MADSLHLQLRVGGVGVRSLGGAQAGHPARPDVVTSYLQKYLPLLRFLNLFSRV